MRFQLLTGLIGSTFFLIGLQFNSNLMVELWSDQILIPIIAGIFVYISTVHIIPEVMKNNSGFKGTLLKVAACTVSVSIIHYLKNYE